MHGVVATFTVYNGFALWILCMNTLLHFLADPPNNTDSALLGFIIT